MGQQAGNSCYLLMSVFVLHPHMGLLAYCASGDRKEEMAEGGFVEGGTVLRGKERK